MIVHLHLVEHMSPRRQNQLLFRDYLRRHAEAAAAYERLKRELAPRFASGGPYSVAKSEFIQATIEPARVERVNGS